MKDESIKIPIFFTLLLVVLLAGSLSSSPIKQFVEGEFASSTLPFMDTFETEEVATATTTFEVEETDLTPTENDEIVSTTTEQVKEEQATSSVKLVSTSTVLQATSTEQVAVSADTSLTKKIINEEVYFDSDPIVIPLKQSPEQPQEEFVYIEDLVTRFIKEKPEVFDARECQTDTLSSRYKNPGECIRALREKQSE